MTNTPTTPAEAVAQWCEANGWTKNPEAAPFDTALVVIADGRVKDSTDSEDLALWRSAYPDCTIYADLPVLPTEQGSLIVDVTTKDGRRFGHMQFDGWHWAGRTDDEAWRYVPSHFIVSWHPGKAVRAEGENNG